MKLLANVDLYFGGGNPIEQGHEFEIDEVQGLQLLKLGTARIAGPPTMLYETKIITPAAPQVSAREPFRDGALPNEEPPAVAPEGDRVLPGADVSEQGAANHSGRRGRSGPAARRSKNPVGSPGVKARK